MSHVQTKIYFFSTLAYYKRRQPRTALSDENAKLKAQCHSKCGTMMIPPVLKITRPSQGSLRLLINEIFSSVTHKNTNLSINQFIYYIFIYYRYSAKVLDSPKNFADLDRCKPSPRHSLWPYHQNIIICLICLNVGKSMSSILHLTLPKISDVHVFTFRNIKKSENPEIFWLRTKICVLHVIHLRYTYVVLQNTAFLVSYIRILYVNNFF